MPAASVARTWKVWLPLAKLLYACGLTQAANGPASRLHWKVLPASVAVKVKLALVLLLTAGGFAVRVVSGGVVSGTTAPSGGRTSQMLRLYLSPVGAVSLIVTLVPLRGVGLVCLCTQ